METDKKKNGNKPMQKKYHNNFYADDELIYINFIRMQKLKINIKNQIYCDSEKKNDDQITVICNTFYGS